MRTPLACSDYYGAEPYFEGIADLGTMSEEERQDFFLRHDNYWV
jgi:hypothetical protein